MMQVYQIYQILLDRKVHQVEELKKISTNWCVAVNDLIDRYGCQIQKLVQEWNPQWRHKKKIQPIWVSNKCPKGHIVIAFQLTSPSKRIVHKTREKAIKAGWDEFHNHYIPDYMRGLTKTEIKEIRFAANVVVHKNPKPCIKIWAQWTDDVLSKLLIQKKATK